MKPQRNNSGVLFNNDKKTEDKQPDYRGEINVNGGVYWLSAWVKVSEKGTKFMSLSVQSQDKQRTSEPAQQNLKNVTGGVADLDSDIPF